MDAVKMAGEQATKTINQAKLKADESTKDDKDGVNACATGYITMEKNHIALDIPEFKMVDQKISLDLPQVTMKQQHIIFGTPSVKCSNVKTGQYPEFTCHDTWIEVGPIKTKGPPACTTTWHDIITTQCVPFLQQQDIVMGIPEVTVDKTSMVLGIPEVTMKRQEWYFDLPKFHLTDGCVGSQCEKKCSSASEKYSNDYQSILQPAISAARISVAKTTTDSLTCQRGMLSAQRDAALASIDANVGVIKASLASLQGMGATDQAKSVNDSLSQLLNMRAKITAQFDSQLQSIDDASKKAATGSMNTQ